MLCFIRVNNQIIIILFYIKYSANYLIVFRSSMIKDDIGKYVCDLIGEVGLFDPKCPKMEVFHIFLEIRFIIIL